MSKASWGVVGFRAGIIVLAILILTSASAWAARAVSTVYAVGSSTIQHADPSASRDDAIADSLVFAVTQVLNELMPPETMEGNFQVLSESIFSRTDQFIVDYQMLTEATNGKTQHVMVKANVSVQRLKEALKQAGVYIGQKKYPLVLFCIAEKQVGEVSYQYWWSGQSFWRAGVVTGAVTGIAKDKGFKIVTPRVGQAMTGYPPELSVPEAVALAQQLQAEIVVVGQAVAEETTNTLGSSLRSFRGTVAVRAYSVRNGQEIGQSQHTAVVTGDVPEAGGKKALADAAARAGNELVSQIAAAWFAKGMGSSKIEVHIQGISGHIAEFVKFRGAVGVMSGVDSVQRKEMQADTAVLLVDYQGSARALAAALMRLSFDTFGLNIAEPEGNTIRLQIVPR